MATQYYFYNVTRNQLNSLPISGASPNSWLTKLHSYKETALVPIFQSVIHDNHWKSDDIIIVISDDNSEYITYTDGTVTTDNHTSYVTPMCGATAYE